VALIFLVKPSLQFLSFHMPQNHMIPVYNSWYTLWSVIFLMLLLCFIWFLSITAYETNTEILPT
jgi:hypothetical protein